jgi:hypothetical protein
MSLSKETIYRGDEEKLDSKYKCTLTGTLTPLPSGTGGLTNLDTYIDALRTAMETDYQVFHVTCGGDTIVSGNPRILGLNIGETNNNWTLTADYTIELEWPSDDTITGDTNLRSISEEWTVEPVDSPPYYSGGGTEYPSHVTVSHQISAQGATTVDTTGWLVAREWVMDRVGWNAAPAEYASYSGLSQWNHARTTTQNEYDGTFSVSESWTLSPTGVVEDFTTTIRSTLESTTVVVEGSIVGLADISIPDTGNGEVSVTTSKYDNALTHWTSISGSLYARATGELGDTTLSETAQNSSIAYNPTQGRISYSFEYADRPCQFVSGSISESINIVDTWPTDIFAQQQIIGRAKGPVLQDMGTVTPYKRSIALEVQMPKHTGVCDACSSLTSSPSSEADTLLCCYKSGLEDDYDQVFKTQDTQSWNPLTGRYSRQVEFTAGYCTGTPTESGLDCS